MKPINVILSDGDVALRQVDEDAIVIVDGLEYDIIPFSVDDDFKATYKEVFTFRDDMLYVATHGPLTPLLMMFGDLVAQKNRELITARSVIQGDKTKIDHHRQGHADALDKMRVLEMEKAHAERYGHNMRNNFLFACVVVIGMAIYATFN